MTAPPIGLLQPWEKIKWSEEQTASIFRDWGGHFKRINLFKKAAETYDKSLNLEPNHGPTLYNRSLCKRNLAETESALNDLRTCEKFEKLNPHLDHGVCDYLYELNRLEDTTSELYNYSRKYRGPKSKGFTDRVTVLEENFKDSLGDALSPFILKHKDTISLVAEEIRKSKIIDNRPRWKKLRDEAKCDVQSNPDPIEVILSPLELARRERAFRVFLQTYFPRSWNDVIFLRNLQSNEDVLLEQTKNSTPELKELLCKGNSTVMKFLKMLEARSPLYNEHLRKCPNLKLCDENKEKYLFRIQYQTRRDLLNFLKNIRKLRSSGKIDKLAAYIENAMGDYVVLKTSRIMPWKFEFMNDVYNILGLAYTDTFSVPTEMPHSASTKERLLTVLKVAQGGTLKANEFVFGDKSTYKKSDEVDPVFEKYKAFVDRMKRRLIFCKFPLEKSYIYHEIAKSHNNQRSFDESVSIARKGINFAKSCNNYVWQFLNIMQIIKSHAALYKLEYLKESLDEARTIVRKLKNDRLQNYIGTSLKYAEKLIGLRKDEMPILQKKKKSSHAHITGSVSSIFTIGNESSVDTLQQERLS